jgi:hypothetical protein
MTPLLVVTASFFVLIICLVGVQTCYFRRRWLLFWLMLLGIILSSGCISIYFYQWFGPAPTQDLPIFNRSPTTPL